jgi:hypothetical protein
MAITRPHRLASHALAAGEVRNVLELIDEELARG